MVRKCKDCGATLSSHNPGLLCWPCQEKKKEQLQGIIGDTPHYTVENLCLLLGLGNPESVKRLGRKGKIPGRLPGVRQQLYLREEVDRWIYGESKEALKKVASDSRLMKHVTDILNLLNTYAGQLGMIFEPEYFLRPPDSETISDKELPYLPYVRDSIPWVDSWMDGQIESENIPIAAKIEIEPSFTALKEHYGGTKLWEQVQTYKQKYGQYVSVGIKVRRSARKLFSGLCIEGTDTVKLWDGIRELLTLDLAPVRVKLNLQGFEVCKPALDITSVHQAAQLLKEYLPGGAKNKTPKHCSSSTGSIDLPHLLGRLVKTYETLERAESNMTNRVKVEKLKGTLPIGTKCEFCSTE